MNCLCSEDASAEGGLLRHFFEIAASGRRARLAQFELHRSLARHLNKILSGSYCASSARHIGGQLMLDRVCRSKVSYYVSSPYMGRPISA